MPHPPRVSFVISAYNAEKTLDRCMRSIQSQAFIDFEVVIVNDGSTDGTQEYLERLSAEDSRFVVIAQKNRGLTHALRDACSLAKGEFIARQDADDFSHPDRLSRQIEALDQNPSACLATSWVEDITSEAQAIGVHKPLPQRLSLFDGRIVEVPGVPAHGSVLIRRNFLDASGGYRPMFYYAQDSDLWLRLADLGSFVTVPKVLYTRLIGVGAISSRFRTEQTRFCELAQDCFRARRSQTDESIFLEEAERLAERCRAKRESPRSRREEATTNFLIAAQLRREHPKIARGYLLKAIRTYPLHLRSWKHLLLSFLPSNLRSYSASQKSEN